MTHTETVYRAICNLKQPCEQGDIIAETKLSLAEVKTALHALYLVKRIDTLDPRRSKGRDNYGEILDFSKIITL